MREVMLNLTQIATRQALHDYLKEALMLPAYYGRNLDALYELLVSESHPLRVTVCYAISPAAEMAEYQERLLRVMDDARRENDRLQVIWQPKRGE